MLPRVPLSHSFAKDLYGAHAACANDAIESTGNRRCNNVREIVHSAGWRFDKNV